MKTKAQAERKRENRRKLILSVAIAFLMFASIFGVVVSRPVSQDTQFYKDIAITPSPLGLIYEVGKKSMTFDNYPDQVEAVPINITSFKSAVIVFDPNSPVEDLTIIDRARISLELNLRKAGVQVGYGINTAVEDNASAYINYPVIPCNPSDTLTVVQLVIGNDTSVTKNGSCITVSGKYARDVLLAKDALSYYYLRAK